MLLMVKNIATDWSSHLLVLTKFQTHNKMEDNIQIFMSFSDLLEVIHNPERVVDLELKRNIIAMFYCGLSVDEVWHYVTSHDNE